MLGLFYAICSFLFYVLNVMLTGSTKVLLVFVVFTLFNFSLISIAIWGLPRFNGSTRTSDGAFSSSSLGISK